MIARLELGRCLIVGSFGCLARNLSPEAMAREGCLVRLMTFHHQVRSSPRSDCTCLQACSLRRCCTQAKAKARFYTSMDITHGLKVHLTAST
jgi:hypothetical protein